MPNLKVLKIVSLWLQTGMGKTGALPGEESDSLYRGPSVGVFGLPDGFGILTTTYVGGRLFAVTGRTAPIIYGNGHHEDNA